MTVANTHARLLMTNGFRRPVEHEIAEVGMGIQAPDVGRTEFQQHLVRSARRFTWLGHEGRGSYSISVLPP